MTISLNEKEISRLESERNIWLATIRKDNRPHLIPLWFIFHENNIYMCTQESVKVKNIRLNPMVSVAMEDAFKVLSFEGIAEIIQPPFSEKLVKRFLEKYDWNITKDDGYTIVIKVVLKHKIAFND
ncbi:MAG: pyridoxamine 5'-phosphate oxidase family protein [Candidatus Heimdallarchaeota archaeon]|nr:pyridoxamine 5'-phosphate oxidase family protein [Candidatus Heimdallarchaeota archaeon]MDH5645175.1 pyridoxamine 5'-phosphate oxidase family protein [Candidatus Heimdallarchaeota archaeon]